jgi:hypothetical protein
MAVEYRQAMKSPGRKLPGPLWLGLDWEGYASTRQLMYCSPDFL